MIEFFYGLYTGLRDSLRFNQEAQLSLSLAPARIALLTITTMAIAHVEAIRAMSILGGAFCVWFIIECGISIVSKDRTHPIENSVCDKWHAICLDASEHNLTAMLDRCYSLSCTGQCEGITILKIDNVTIAEGPWRTIRVDGSVARFLIEAGHDGPEAEKLCRALDEAAGIEP